MSKKTSFQKKKKKAKGEHGLFYYLNPMHLMELVEGYGFIYSIKKILASYMIAIVAGIAISVLYKLNVIQGVVVCFMAIFATPFIIRNTFKVIYQQNRFTQVNKYIEKMLYYFETSGKILVALKDMLHLFPSGEMREALEDAIEHIETSSSQKDITEEALLMIEEKFPCGRLRTLHGFLLSVERNGGNSDTAIDLLLKDRNLWADRVLDTQKRKNVVKTNIVISIILTLILCLSIIYLPSMIASNIALPDITSYGIVSWTAVILIGILLVLYIKGDNKLCIDWLDDDDIWDEEQAEKEYNAVVKYDSTSGFRESLIWALGAFIVSLILMLFLKNTIMLVVGMCLVVFMLNQHTIGHNLAKKKIEKAIEKAFPTWLMSVSLLMQTENVRMAIRESYYGAPSILKPALLKLIEDLDKKPDSEEPFNDFLAYFHMPEISDAMSTLYSLSNGSGGDADTEFRNIVNRILKMMDRAEEIKNDDKIAVLGIYVSAPSLIGALKLIIDMTALLFAFFEMT